MTTHIRGDVPLKVKLTAYTDRTFKFIIKPPETSWFLHKASGVEKFTPLPGHDSYGDVPVQYIYEIAKIKKEMDPDLKKVDLPQIMNVKFALIIQMVVSQLYSCGLSLTTDPIKPKPVVVKSKV